MPEHFHRNRPTVGVLAGWQFYRTATNLSYLLPVFRGIIRAAQDLNCNLLMGCGMGASASPDDPWRPAWPHLSPDVDFVPVGPWNTDGLIVFTPLHSPERSQYVQDRIAGGHPVLFIGSGETGPTIVADNTNGILEAVDHLIKHGHRRIAFIAGSPDDLKGDTGERLRAYHFALEKYGLESEARLVVYGRHVFDGGYSSMRQIIASGAAFTAVVASNDESALGAIQALREAGRSVPQDVAVIGFDNRLEGAAHRPSLSSIHLPLFNMGHRAVETLLDHIEGKAALPETIRIESHLVARESCGCGIRKTLPERWGMPLSAAGQPPSNWSESISAMVMSQAQNLEEKECRSYCARLVDSFVHGIAHADRSEFLKTLEEVVQRTMTGDDDASLWQDAVSIIGQQVKGAAAAGSSSVSLVDEVLDQARLTISTYIQRHHRQYVSDQRWISSRLSLLTARLLTALDENQVYAILAQHLPDMDIQMASLVLFDEEAGDPAAWSMLRNVLDPAGEVVRFRSTTFPPAEPLSGKMPSQLVLIPLSDQSGQLGYMVFGVEYFDLYGAIVQQLGGALNTTRLYRQATEGRRLAEEANRMKSRFLSTISHELRTPLNLIVGLSGMAIQANKEGDTALPEPALKDLERIHMYSQHLGGLIGDVLDLATSDAGQLRLNMHQIDLGQTLRIVAESGRQLASDKGLVWEVDLPETGPWVSGDQTRLRQVALNLINNAIKFTQQGSVSLRLKASAGTAVVQVMDTGLGISSDEQQAIFDEFRQSERSVALGYGGLGLGLAISKRLVEMHGGTIGVHSSGQQGAGSTFFFTLPTVPPPAKAAPSKPAAVKPRLKQKVLVLTNHPDASVRLGEQLTRHGFKVQVTLVNSSTGWQSGLFKSMPDAVLLDVSLASDLGWDVLLAIKGSHAVKEIPVMFFRSTQENGSLLDVDYLTKPIELAELTRALDQHWLVVSSERSVRSILVVDDEPNTLDLHVRIVQSHASSNHVFKARTGREALEILRQEIIDLVLLDLQMPEMDGFSVLETMRENESMRAIPVIVVTGKVLTEADMARLNRGVAAVLEKGLFSLDETAAHIHAALERKRRLSGEAQRLVRKAMAFIHEHATDPISRQDIAQHVNIAGDYLTFCFRQELGTTPIEYLQRYRVNQARLLLKDSERTITQVALDVGFSDSGYFSRIFRRITGMTPEAFRRS